MDEQGKDAATLVEFINAGAKLAELVARRGFEMEDSAFLRMQPAMERGEWGLVFELTLKSPQRVELFAVTDGGDRQSLLVMIPIRSPLN